jgi:hypothetical protein
MWRWLMSVHAACELCWCRHTTAAAAAGDSRSRLLVAAEASAAHHTAAGSTTQGCKQRVGWESPTLVQVDLTRWCALAARCGWWASLAALGRRNIGGPPDRRDETRRGGDTRGRRRGEPSEEEHRQTTAREGIRSAADTGRRLHHLHTSKLDDSSRVRSSSGCASS